MKKFLTDIDVIGGEQISENSVLYGSSSSVTLGYSERVRLSGGIIESLPCVANKIEDFGNLFANGSVYASKSLVTDGFMSATVVKTQSIQMPNLSASGPVKYASGSLTSVSGYTGSFIVQGETWNTTKTIYIQDGIIINVV
jgi:hypothetical protein